MPDSNKHKIFSKEELFKLIDEKKSLPPEADDFDQEAMEGLSMLTDRKKVDGLNNSIDEVLRLEKAKAKKKRNLYVLSAAASLLLMIGVFFLLKDTAIDKKESTLAENTTPVNETPKVDKIMQSEENKLEERSALGKTENGPVATSTGEVKGKEGKMLEQEIVTENAQKDAAGDVTVVAPTEVAANIRSKTEDLKSTNEEAELDKNEKNSGGKDQYKTTLAKPDLQLKGEEAKKADTKLEDKEKEKNKTKYVTNTVWTTPASGATVDESKNKSADDRSQIKQDQGGAAVVTSNNEPAPKKEAEQVVVTTEKQVYHSEDKKRKANKKEVAKPDTVVTDMLAGYSYYEKKPGRDDNGDGDLQKAQQTNQPPVQTQNGNTDANRELVPEFVGGETGVKDYVKKNLKISNPKYKGTIDVEFLVKNDGTVDTTSIKIVKKIKGCEVCSKDVIQLIKGMPKWVPAKATGKETERARKISVPYAADQEVK